MRGSLLGGSGSVQANTRVIALFWGLFVMIYPAVLFFGSLNLFYLFLAFRFQFLDLWSLFYGRVPHITGWPIRVRWFDTFILFFLINGT
jgi:hypothetical protein